MAYSTKYRLQFSNQLNEKYYIFFNKKDYIGDVTFLTGTGGALLIKSFNSDDDRFSPILSKECTISIHVDKGEAVGILDFLADEDDDWNIVVYRELEQQPIFEGFMIVEDSSQPLHDRPFQLTIRASDGLALLKSIPLVNASGVAFTGLNNISDYLAAALYRANPDVDYKFYYDIFHNEMDMTVCPFAQMQIDVKTFEKDETTYEDCYTVLQKICTDLQCRLFYENGYWHIVSLWQYHTDAGFSYWIYQMVAGALVLSDTIKNDYTVAKIGKDELMYAVNKDAIEYYKVASKSVKKTYNYETPRSLIKNQDLKDGVLIPGSQGSTGTPPNQLFYEGYTLPGYDAQRGVVVVGAPLTNAVYVKREFDAYNYEKDRYIVMPTQSSAPTTVFLLSSQFPIGQSDKINVSVESKIKNNYSGAQTSLVFAVLLRADDGTYYSLDDNGLDGTPGQWFSAGTNFSSGLRVIQHSFAPSDDKSEWITTTVNSSAAPKSGQIQIVFYEQSGNSYPNETWYKNIQISYSPFVKNSYRPAAGDYNIYSQDLKINKAVDEIVYISDSPKKIIKGALFVNGFLASPEWYRIDYPAERFRFTQIMALIKYNFTFRQFQKIEGSIKGLSLFNTNGDNLPFGFLPQYSFSDIPNQLTTKYILTSFEVDYYTGIWRGVLVAVQINSLETFDTYDFQYLFQ